MQEYPSLISLDCTMNDIINNVYFTMWNLHVSENTEVFYSIPLKTKYLINQPTDPVLQEQKTDGQTHFS